MKISFLRTDGFRNLRNVSLAPCGGVNVLYGRNGQGKTSLLEAIWLISAGTSFRTTRISETVGFDAPFARVQLTCETGTEGAGRVLDAELTLDCTASLRKTFTVNGVARRPGGEMLDLPMVVFRPEDLFLVKEGPAERRALLDNLGVQWSPRYRKNAQEYNRCLQQRNTLLKNLPGRRLDQKNEALLDVLDVALSRLGVYLTRTRISLLDRLAPAAEALYRGISGGAETLSVAYDSGFFAEAMPESIREAELLGCERLYRQRSTDVAAGFTTVGAHRDDIILSLDGRPARVFGSQGQQRTCAIACRLGSAQVLGELCGEPPVVLLDDVFSELDPERCRFILDTVSQSQIFLTGCDLPLLEGLAPKDREIARFRIENGGISD